MIAAITGIIPQGVRNNTLTSYAGSLRARGFDRAEILEALREANQKRCAPPLSDFELRNIAKSAAKWKPYPTGCGIAWRAVNIPRGCFDPRPAACGFNAAAIVESDTPLGLWRNHKALYAFLVGFFGPWGCHPSQTTIGERLGIPQQHVARHARRLERAGLLLVEPGAYRQAEKRYGCNSYHFVRHGLFAPHFTRRGLPVLNDLSEFPHHCDEFSTGKTKTSLENQQLAGILTHRGVVDLTEQGRPWVLGREVGGGAVENEQQRRERKRKFAQQQNLTGAERDHFLAWSIPGGGPGYRIVQYVECVAHCGGARIVFNDGTVKRYECSCETATEPTQPNPEPDPAKLARARGLVNRERRAVELGEWESDEYRGNRGENGQERLTTVERTGLRS
jgi:DNA-binding transcriptional ArsR family regulator